MLGSCYKISQLEGFVDDTQKVFGFPFLRLCVCARARVYTCVRTLVHCRVFCTICRYVHMCERLKVDVHVFFSHSPPEFLSQAFSLSLKLAVLAGQPVLRICHRAQRWVTVIHHHSHAFKQVPWDLNSGSYPCTAGALLTKQSPQPLLGTFYKQSLPLASACCGPETLCLWMAFSVRLNHQCLSAESKECS